jgi:hypothetical protein
MHANDGCERARPGATLGRMHARWPLALAISAMLASPLHAGAQGRVSVGVNTGRPARPGPHSLRLATGRPFPTTGIVPPLRGALVHRPTLFRSPILGLFVFDPYWWLDPEVGLDSIAPPVAMPAPGPILSGGLQLDVEPRRALVYVDGVLAGTVDQFKGYFLHLETSAGFHVITFLSPDYEPLTIGVTVSPNQTTTYRGSLNRSR